MLLRPVSLNIKYYRKIAGFTQAEVAEMLGMDKETYSLKENNIDIDLIFLNNLSTILNTDIGNLICNNFSTALSIPQSQQILLTNIEKIIIEKLRSLPKEKVAEIFEKISDEYDSINRL